MKAIQKILGGMIVAILASAFFAGSALAVPMSSEYQIFTNDPVGQPTFYQKKTGFYIWSNDEFRRNWSIRWTAPEADVNPVLFSGTILLSANEFSDVKKFKFENSGIHKDQITRNFSDFVQFDAAVNNSGGVDGLDLTILGDIKPAYIGFDLFSYPYGTDIADKIFIGKNNWNPADQDFKIAAPVPEPATLLLLAAGLVGLGIARRRRS